MTSCADGRSGGSVPKNAHAEFEGLWYRLSDEDRAEVYNRILMKLSLPVEQFSHREIQKRAWSFKVRVVGYLTAQGIEWFDTTRVVGDAGIGD